MHTQPVEVFAARQPIFDRQRRVAGYELLYRASERNRYEGGDPEVVSALSLERTLLGFGLRTLIGDRVAWINATRGLLVRGHWELLPPGSTVIELLETIEPDAEVIAACRRLRDAGYRIALDDYRHSDAMRPLLELAEWVKVDFRGQPRVERHILERDLRRRGHRLLAEKIETHEEHVEAMESGYELFQGFFFCRPEMMRMRDVAPNRIVFLRLLRAVNGTSLDLGLVEELVQQDVSLSMKLLRFLHSAANAWAAEVTSIRQALLILGERQIRRWVSLVAVFGLARGKPGELVVVALTRARFAEHLAALAGLEARSDDLFLAGLLSVADALTDQPLEAALEPLGLSAEVREALLVGAPPIGPVLRLVLAWELGAWDVVEKCLHEQALDESTVARAYADAVLWAEDRAQP
ncbi:MAG: HDOD domain-containing protein [Candidatus Eisenbacteria bacterium]|uniref:HDOD domain-containing protein n=1 Tax=Eiseniibacteriota bacterium TaxID=2212470 RepID=A0A933SGG6_UNCEI|nr:HDOD domain-containing protein [Candidatus Eisenbacteria bacterium]